MYIENEDSKTYKGILDVSFYEDIFLQKKKYIDHVEKRIGRRLRNAKKANKDVRSKGSGKLTDKVISELTTYGLAIRQYPDSIEKIKEAVWTTYYHMCPPGSTSRSKWRKAEANNALDTS